MNSALRLALWGVILLLVASCSTGPQPRGETAGQVPSAGVSSQNRTVTIVVRYEVTDLAPKFPGQGNPMGTKRVFNAFLALVDGTGTPQPYLVDTLPQLNTDGWRVFPDGRMETTYKLRPGLTWHDGQPLTAEDFAFAFRLYTAPALRTYQTVEALMEDVAARDRRTIIIRWHSPYADAGALKDGDLDPLPAHLLEQSFAALENEPEPQAALLAHPFWTAQYVGAGPYRLERWVPGSHLDGVAFDGHVLGRAKIDRVQVRIIADENVTLTNLLAGNVDFASVSLRFEHARVLQGDWMASNQGIVLLRRGGPVSLMAQLRPEFVGDPGLDLRVRRALAHSLDRQALNAGLFEGQGFPTESFVPEGTPAYGDVDRALMKYPFDARRTEQLMGEAGYSKDREGLFAGPGGERFKLGFRVTAGSEFERMQAILTDNWRRTGFDVQSSVLPAAQARDREVRQKFTGLSSQGGAFAERRLTTAEIGSPANRWAGENRGGWSNADYDRVWEAFTAAPDRGERIRHFTQLMRLLSENLPWYMMYFAVQVTAYGATLRGPDPGIQEVGTLTPGTPPHYNVYEWAFRS